MRLLRRKKSERSYSLSAFAWQRLKRSKLSMFGIFIIAITTVVSILGYLITPDSSPDADTHVDEIAKEKPGFKCMLIRCRKNTVNPDENIFQVMLFGKPNDYEYHALKNYWFEGNDVCWEEYIDGDTIGPTRKYPLFDALYSINTALPMVNDTINGFAEFYPNGQAHKMHVAVADMRKQIRDNIFTRRFYFGTDHFGRDMLSRIMIGSRISLFVGFVSVAISIIIGILMGALSGFFRGWVDELIMWVINVVWSIPTLLLVIAITLVLGKGIFPIFVAVGLTMWVDTARVVRGQILSLREKEYVEAGRALGFSNWRIIFRHVLPNVMGPVIVISANNFAAAILIESGLSFLGIGAKDPTPSWGMMISEYQGYIISGLPYLAILPGLAIMFVVLAFMLLGNGLRDAIDTKMSGEDQIMT